jgi:hypothetical protein
MWNSTNISVPEERGLPPAKYDSFLKDSLGRPIFRFLIIQFAELLLVNTFGGENTGSVDLEMKLKFFLFPTLYSIHYMT